MNLKAISLVVLVLLIYFGLHFFLYFSTAKFFAISNQTLKKALAVVFIFLSVSFFAAMILTRLSDLVIFRVFYGLSAFWLGLIINLLMAAVLAWLIIFVFKLFNLDVKLIVGSLAFSIILLYSLFGVWQAMHPQVKNIDVTIAGLPQAWQNKTIVQLSDLHLGQIYGIAFAEKVVKQVNDLKPDLIVITGDLFDGTASNLAKFLGTLDQLQADQGIYFITGNHEVYLGTGKVKAALQDTKINILDNQIADLDSLQIIGVSYPEFGQVRDSNFIASLAGYNPSLPSILLYHSPTSIEQKEQNLAGQHSNIYWSPNTDFSLARASGINLQLSGHSHAGQTFPFTWVADKIYGKYNYGLNQDGDFNIYTTSGVGTWGPPMRIGSRGEIVEIRLK